MEIEEVYQKIETYKKTQSIGKKELSWIGKFKILSEFYIKYGHSEVTNENCQGDSVLLKWVIQQKRLYKFYHYDNLRYELLKFLSFEFIYLTDWEKKYNQLVKFKEKYEHINVAKENESKELIIWLKRQYRYYVEGRLKIEKYEKLIQLGVDFTLKNQKVIKSK